MEVVLVASAAQGRVTSELRLILAEGVEAGVLPRRLCHACAEFLPVSGVSISLMNDASTQQLLCASDETARLVDELQFTRGRGPCLDAFTDGGPVLAGDLSDVGETGRWPAFADEAIGLGARAVFAFPLQLGAIRLGVLDLYRDTPGPLGPDVVSEVLTAADIICAALLDVVGVDGNEDAVAQWLDEMPHGRANVHQATGMLMARLDVTAQEALARLRGRAFLDGLMLGELAAGVVAGTIDLNDGW